MPSPSPAEIRAQLREIRFLDGLTDGDYHFLSSRIDPVSYASDALIFQEGSTRELFALITKGSVAIEKNAGAQPVRLTTFGTGQAIGEGLLLDDTAHGTTARTLEPTQTLVIRLAQLQEIIRERPTLYAALVARAA